MARAAWGAHDEVETPNWSTKIRCSCGHEEPSRAQMWKHQAEALRAERAAVIDCVNLYGTSLLHQALTDAGLLLTDDPLGPRDAQEQDR